MRHRTLTATVAALASLAAALGLAGPPTGAAPAQAAPAADLFVSEYVEGTGFNKAVELANATGAPVDLAAGGYTLQLYSNGAAAPSQSVALTGTVADGDVFVVSRADADPAIVAQADQLAPAVANWNGDDAVVLRKGGTGGAVVDVVGQVGVDPGTEWGTGDTSTADATIRRKPTVTAGDTNPSDAFDPAVEWDGFPVNTLDGLGSHTVGGGPGNAPVTVTCGSPLATTAGTAATRTITATDPDGTVVDVAVTGVAPAPAAGTIERTAFTPATAPGGTAEAVVTVSADVSAGSYAVTVTATNDDGTAQSATCTLTVSVQGVRPIGEVQGPVTDTTPGATFQSPLVGQQVVVRAVVTQKTLALSSAGNRQNGLFLQDTPAGADDDPTTSDGVFVFLGGFTTLLRADGGPAYLPQVGDELTLRATVTEFFNLTQLTSPRLIAVGGDRARPRRRRGRDRGRPARRPGRRRPLLGASRGHAGAGPERQPGHQRPRRVPVDGRLGDVGDPPRRPAGRPQRRPAPGACSATPTRSTTSPRPCSTTATGSGSCSAPSASRPRPTTRRRCCRRPARSTPSTATPWAASTSRSRSTASRSSRPRSRPASTRRPRPARRPPPATARWRCRPTTSRTSTTSATTPPTAATSSATPAARA